jgi:hypothetical protein
MNQWSRIIDDLAISHNQLGSNLMMQAETVQRATYLLLQLRKLEALSPFIWQNSQEWLSLRSLFLENVHLQAVLAQKQVDLLVQASNVNVEMFQYLDGPLRPMTMDIPIRVDPILPLNNMGDPQIWSGVQDWVTQNARIVNRAMELDDNGGHGHQ